MSCLHLVGRPQQVIKVTAEEAYQHALQFIKRIEQAIIEARNPEERQMAFAQHKRARTYLRDSVARMGDMK